MKRPCLKTAKKEAVGNTASIPEFEGNYGLI